MARRPKKRTGVGGVDGIAEMSADFLRPLMPPHVVSEASRLYPVLYPRQNIAPERYAQNKADTLRSYVRRVKPVQPAARDAWQLAGVLNCLRYPCTRRTVYPWSWGPVMLFNVGRFETFVRLASRLLPEMDADGAIAFLDVCGSPTDPRCRNTWEWTTVYLGERLFRDAGITTPARHWSIVAAENAAHHYSDGPQVQRDIILHCLREFVKTRD